jgi:hypothetical protein
VDPAVKNLAQVKVGDKIGLTYYQSVAASLSKAGDAPAASNQIETDTAKAGERPGASARSTTSVPVTIVSVDTQKNVVKFRGDDELVRSTDVLSPEGKSLHQEPEGRRPGVADVYRIGCHFRRPEKVTHAGVT